jgi:hypothetical protein
MGRGRDPDIIPFRGPANLSRMAERAGFEYHPLSGARKPIQNGGEGGIRTREPLWVTRFPSVRAKPATRPLH